MKKPAWWLWCGAGMIYAFLYAPILVVVLYSFNAAKRGGPWKGFTVDWYGTLWSSPEKLSAVRNTLILAATSTVISTVLGNSLGLRTEPLSFSRKTGFSQWLCSCPQIVILKSSMRWRSPPSLPDKEIGPLF